MRGNLSTSMIRKCTSLLKAEGAVGVAIFTVDKRGKYTGLLTYDHMTVMDALSFAQDIHEKVSDHFVEEFGTDVYKIRLYDELEARDLVKDGRLTNHGKIEFIDHIEKYPTMTHYELMNMMAGNILMEDEVRKLDEEDGE